MYFELTLAAVAKPAFALVATHGLTDFDSKWVGPYTAAMLLPLPTEAVTATFCVASVVHFSEDLGPHVSLGVHATVLAIGLLSGTQTAFMAMLAYLTLVHVPAHYTRCAFRGRGAAAARALAAGLVVAVAAALAPPTITIPFDDTVQRIVVAHIIVEAQSMPSPFFGPSTGKN